MLWRWARRGEEMVEQLQYPLIDSSVCLFRAFFLQKRNSVFFFAWWQISKSKCKKGDHAKKRR